MHVDRFIVGPLETNCYLIRCGKTGESVLVDPGGISSELIASVRGTKLSAVILTHGHFDHIGGLKKIVELTGAPVLIHELDAPMLLDPFENGSFMIGVQVKTVEASSLIADGDTVPCGSSSLRVFHTPGHTEGSVSFAADGEFIISGDTLFRLSVGRWDLPGGSHSQLMESLRTVYSPLPDPIAVFPGHGESTTMGYEKRYNQFMADFDNA
ncbi:MBL fold metallo-hydrolase [bacterium]|nr:MBL fold metallo-hydrolase [bacterium]